MKFNHIFFLPLILILVGCGETDREQQQQARYEAQLQQQLIETNDSFRNDLAEVLETYFLLKDTLVASNAEDAVQLASDLSQKTGEADVFGLNDETVLIWASFADLITTYSNRLMKQTDVDDQRVYFEEISETMIQIVDSFRPVGYEIFVQSCPMVRGKTADWLSLEQQIKNPYQGDRMLHCGEVLRRI